MNWHQIKECLWVAGGVTLGGFCIWAGASEHNNVSIVLGTINLTLAVVLAVIVYAKWDRL